MSVTVDNGRIAQADFAFYAGPVGVRDREGQMEAAYFGRTRAVRLPAVGTLDGEPVRVVDIQSSLVRPGSTQRAVTLTLVRES